MDRWLEIILPAAPDGLETLEAQLTAEGFDSFQVEDSRDFTAYREGWDFADDALCDYYENRCQIRLYLPENDSAPPKIESLRLLVPALTVESRAEEDWAENWKQYYHPMAIGRRLLVQPAWLPVDNPDNRAVFYNNPGMSFGTGLHATTRLCLEILESLPLDGQRVLDVGCGSGILSLCALHLGARSALGLDIDQLAADISLRNAKANGLDPRYKAQKGNLLEDEALRSSLGQWELICSNIVADVIIAMAPLIKPLLSPGGQWLISGIITPRLGDVLSALKQEGWQIILHKSADDWQAMLGVRS